ncbi:unnamed protein product, partial [Vitis vinifera]|uniref:CCHC-type domain-containing protein n=1 Tax=Vitis vinifera TaxID=29760 RepID=D7UBA8_VITVI
MAQKKNEDHLIYSTHLQGLNHLLLKWLIQRGKGIKCFKCQEPSHMAYNCPKKNLHIGLEHEEEPKLQKNEQNENSFPNRLLFSEVTPLDAT